jgi:hypothetical protein
LKQYGFTLIPDAKSDEYIAVRKQKDKDIYVLDYGYDDDEEELELEIELNYKTDLDKGAKTKTGWIPAKRLKDLIDQYEIPQLREHNLINIINKEIKNLHHG